MEDAPQKDTPKTKAKKIFEAAVAESRKKDDHLRALARSPEMAALLADKDITAAYDRYERISNRSKFYDEGWRNLFENPKRLIDDDGNPPVGDPLVPLSQRVEKLRTEFTKAAMVEKDAVEVKLLAKLEPNVTDSKERRLMAAVYFSMREDTEKTGYLYSDPGKPAKGTVDTPEQKKSATEIQRRFDGFFEKLTVYANNAVVNAKQDPKKADDAVDIYCQCANAWYDTQPNFKGEFPDMQRAQKRAEAAIALIQATPSLAADPRIKSEFLPALSILNSDIKSHNNSYLPKGEKPKDVKTGTLLPRPVIQMPEPAASSDRTPPR